ncbi:uncharacterized protein ATNIH1004_009143 [Aspergillus tanneri]|uniref:Amidoligase enzyme n=1 Tax=Aspergillus tanneri TaxID=1220188 RepID=A0A5M9MD69_9EURO|nr:uncharacterized protein ATNIH1004_009143 [Aspergillus tanneri]KAA8644932.1 hypothetical protein ATNIH1004_009143 [Aspergillus tanneri]
MSRSTYFPPPPPPPPRLPPYKPRGGAKAPVVHKESPPPPGSFGIGIEMELLLESRFTPSAADNTFPRFARQCAMSYNSSVPSPYPRMHSLVQAQWEGVPHTQWVLHHDPTCETQQEPWGIEIISPLLRSHPGSQWRQSVEALWSFINQKYIAQSNADCSTHVHISRVEGFSTTDVKRVAQAIIHFEPAFEALVPPERRGNEYSRSNWLDNPQLGYQNLSRDQSIELIESRNTTDEIIGIMNPNQSKYFGWNFLPLKTFRTIEFRRGSASLSANDAFTWVELAMSFIQAAMIQPSSQQLLRYPRTIGGLKDFIQYAHLPQQEGAYNSAYLQRLFTGSHPNAKLNPIPVGHLSEQKRAKLQRKMDADTASNPMLDIIASAQQHGVA